MRGRDDRQQNLEQHLYREKMRQQRSRQRSAAISGASPAASPGRRPARRPPAARPSRRRGVVVLCIALLLFASILVYRLYQIQIVDNEVNAELAASQHYKKIPENPRRGIISDRNGVELAGTTYVYRIGITPKDMRSITKNITSAEIAAKIAECLNLDPAAVAAEMAKTDKTYIQLKKDVPRAEADALKAYISKDTIGGIRIDSEPRRYYSNGTLASQVIGYTRFSEGQLIGQLGIELEYNTLLTGEPGYTYVETDNYTGMGQLPFSVPTSLQAKDGQNILLNIDINIQKIAQEELANAISVYDITEGGTVIVMNPYTGAILAMASSPFFSSSDPTACPEGYDAAKWDTSLDSTIKTLSEEVWRNRAISDTYEPGSTMKAVTAAIALEENLARESEMMSDASLSRFGWTIRCAHAGGHGMETMQQGFWRSCNPIFAQLALRTSVSCFYSYIGSFGFRSKTGIDLPSEESGILHQDPTEIDMTTLSYGESSTVTPLQLATAYCAFANGGNLIQPRVVKAILDSKGNIVQEAQPETIRKVLSESTTARIRELLKGVVLFGTGSAAYVEGYAIAGKTSTSTDDNGDHTLSFAGIAPAENPEIVTLVVLNKPKDKEMTSKGAAKTCGLIISRTLEYMGISRTYSENDISRLNKTTAIPDVTGMTYAEALKELGQLGFTAEAGESAMGDATLVKYQWPAAETLLHSKGLVVLYPVAEPEEALVVIPDFTGKNVNECLSAATDCGLNIRIVGDCLGVAVSQSPGPTYGGEPEITPEPSETAAAGTETSPATTEPAAGTDNHIKRGSIISISFAAVEEEVAESGETD